jgi:methylphosphotriester-DNA--protein-cysteine methyltransferase
MTMGTNAPFHERPAFEMLETVDSLLDRLFPKTFQTGTDWRAKKLKDFVDNAPGKVHGNLAHVCKELELSLSDSQARRLFKACAGISITEYARKRRLMTAAKQLQDTDEPVKVVATDAGYRTHQAFRNSFYEMFGLTPMEFRRMWRRSQVTA